MKWHKYPDEKPNNCQWCLCIDTDGSYYCCKYRYDPCGKVQEFPWSDWYDTYSQNAFNSWMSIDEINNEVTNDETAQIPR